VKKIVVNACYGGFGLSDKALLRLEELGWPKRFRLNERKDHYPHDEYWSDAFDDAYHIRRDNHLLIQVVEDMGEEANGPYAKLEIVEIPDDVEWQIDEYDGIEWVAECHRRWFPE
jgi:hypothetical protein